MQKPTIGRIVLYRVGEGESFKEFRSNGVKPGEYLPAMVVRLLNVDGPYADMVNLRVFTDCGGELYATSVRQGTANGEWSWPHIERT